MPNQPFDVLLMPGIRQDVDPLVAPKGTLVDAQNVRYGRVGGIYPRWGTRTIPPTSSSTAHVIEDVTEGVGIVSRVGEAGVLGVAGKVFAWDETRDRFDFCGSYSKARPLRKRLGLGSPSVGSTTGAARYAVAVNSLGYLLIAASNSTVQIQIKIESPEGGRVTVGSSTATKCAAVSVGTTFYLVSQNGTTITAEPVTVGASANVTIGAPATVGTLTSSGSYWDVTPAADGTHWYLVHQSGAATIRVDRFSGTTSNANNTQAVTGTCPLSLYADATDVYVGWHNDPGVTGEVRYRTLAPDLGTFRSAVTTIDTATTYGPPLFGPSGTAGTGQYAFRHSSQAVSPFTVAMRWGTASSPANSGSAGTVTGPTVSWHAVPISKPDSAKRIWVIFGCQAENWQFQRAALVRMDNASQAAIRVDPTVELVFDQTEQPHSANMPSAIVDMFHHVAEGSASHFFAIPQLLQRAQSTDTRDLIAIELLEYQPSSVAPHRGVAELGDSVVVAGQPVELFGMGSPNRFDTGASSAMPAIGAAEVGFAYRPAVLTATQVAGGNLSEVGVYSWLFVFEWPDALGRRHRSAPSAIYQTTLTTGNRQVDFQVTALAFSQRQYELAPGFPARIVPYRTVSNGTTFYREAAPTQSPSAISLTTGRVVWQSGAASIHTDALISTNEIDYTDGGVKANDCAPSCIFMVETEERLWLGGLWDGELIQASKIRVPGEPVQFTDHASFKVVLPDLCTGLAYQDGSVIAFAQNAIYVISGDGPNDQGIGSFSPPRAICRDIGCDDYRSILETAQGVLFKSKRGFYLLPRGNGIPVFIGAAVQRKTDPNDEAYVTVLGAATKSDSRSRTAQFLVQQSDGDTIRLVYDLDIASNDPLNGWSYDTFSNDLLAMGQWPDGVLLVKSDLTSSTHLAYYDEIDTTQKTDASNSENITSAVQTAQIRPGGLAGEIRCLSAVALLSNTDGGTLTLGLLIDDRAAEVAGSSTLSASTGSIYREVSAGRVADCSAFAVRMSVLRSGAILGPTFHGFTANVQPSGSTRKTDSTER